MDQTVALAVLFAEVGAAFSRFADSLDSLDRGPTQVAAPAPVAAPTETAAPAPVAAPTETAAHTPAFMTVEAFTAKCREVLQRHGGDQAPLQVVLAKYSVAKPAQELTVPQYPSFLHDLQVAYGEEV